MMSNDKLIQELTGLERLLVAANRPNKSLALLPDTQKFWHEIPLLKVSFFSHKICCFGMLGASAFFHSRADRTK